MAILGPVAVLFIVALVVLHLFERRTKKYQAAQKIPGPGPCLPLIGNGLNVVPLNPVNAFPECRKNAAKYRDGYKYYFFGKLYLFTHSVEAFEAVLNLTETAKGPLYNFLLEFLGRGLLTANGHKWVERRKMITPAFHFNILKQFLVDFCHHADHFVKSVRYETRNGTDITERIPSYSLDVICATSMGADTINLDTSDYLHNFHMIDRKLAQRAANPALHHDVPYKLFGYKKEMQTIAGKIHNFTNDLISKRRVIFQNSPSRQKALATKQNFNENGEQTEEDNAYFQKHRCALLDSLLSAELKGAIGEEGIKEEVDTFVFTGHDTVSNGIIYTLMCIAENTEVQDKLYAELHNAFKDCDPTEPFTVPQVASLSYLDLVIKESLRMFPPVPFFNRVLLEDMELNGVSLPAGTEMIMFIYDLHHNPANFPEPEKFIPERFLPENVEKRHRFAYVPFSAGVRNCVGQKFALLELKTLVIKLLLAYRFESITKIKDLVFVMEMILHSYHPIKLRFVPRI